MYYLLKYHKKKLLEGIAVGGEGGIVTTYGATSGTSDVKTVTEKTIE
jgi:hypothetical protein